jgi:hypothetical protein
MSHGTSNFALDYLCSDIFFSFLLQFWETSPFSRSCIFHVPEDSSIKTSPVFSLFFNMHIPGQQQ